MSNPTATATAHTFTEGDRVQHATFTSHTGTVRRRSPLDGTLTITWDGSGRTVHEYADTELVPYVEPVQLARVEGRIDMGRESWDLTPTRTVREAVEQLIEAVNRLGHAASVYLVQMDAEDAEIGRYESTDAQPGDELADVHLRFA